MYDRFESNREKCGGNIKFVIVVKKNYIGKVITPGGCIRYLING